MHEVCGRRRLGGGEMKIKVIVNTVHNSITSKLSYGTAGKHLLLGIFYSVSIELACAYVDVV